MTNKMNVRLFKPTLGKEELNEIADSFEKSWVGLGPKVAKFENQWAEFVGAKSAVAVNSATAALHLALKCFGFPKGSKVLVPSLTFASSATAILYNDLIPVFVDSDPITLGMSVTDLKEKYSEDCVAVVAVHYAGHPLPIDEITDWAGKLGLRVIEDCAHTAGADYKGKMLGLWGDIGCYSFEEKKLMTTGDGGMIVSNNPEYLKDMFAYRWVGIDKDNWQTAQEYVKANKDAMHWFYEINLLGYKYNMNDLAASIGLVQLKKLPTMNQRRSEIIARYLDGLSEIKQVKPLLPFDPNAFCYQMFGIRVDLRDELMVFLKSKGVATGCHYTPLSIQPLFKEYAFGCDFVEREHARFITLPLHFSLTNDEIDYVISCIGEFYSE